MRIASLFRSTYLILVAACAADVTSSPRVPPAAPDVSVCRVTAGVGTTVRIPIADLAAARRAGDYLTNVFVDPASTLAGDSIHYRRIDDAIAAVRAGRLARGELESAACKIAITVAKGTYRGSPTESGDPAVERFPLVIDVPGITLHGALHLPTDPDERVTGDGSDGAATILTPTVPLVVHGVGSDDPIIVVAGHPKGSAGNGVSIEGLAFQSGHPGVDTLEGGVGILSVRVRDLSVSGNRFEAGLTSAVDVRASSAQVSRNHVIGGNGCDICLGGPGEYHVDGNRIAGGGIYGVFVLPVVQFPVPAGVEPFVLPESASVTAVVENNEILDHLVPPTGAAVRVATIGQNAQNVVSSAHVDIRNNALDHNLFAIQVDAGFPLANTTLRGDAVVALSNNVITRTCQRDLLVAFTRHVTALGAGQPTRPYVHNSTYRLTLDAALSWQDAWYADPAGYGNLLTVDGATIPNGTRVGYDANRICAPTGVASRRSVAPDRPGRPRPGV